MRRLLLPLLAVMLAVPHQSQAQPHDDSYQFAFLTGWPPELQDARPNLDGDTYYPYDLLPFVDTLALGYAPRVFEGQPFLDLRLDWQPGAYGVYDDVLMPYDELPPDIRIVAVDLSADVIVHGDSVASLHVALDSLALPPLPDVYAWTRAPAWEALFVDTPADEARRLFDEGFTLRDLEIERVVFASYGEEIADEGVPPYDPRYPTGIGIYPPRGGIWVDWIIWPRSPGKRGVDRLRRGSREGIGRDVPSDDDRDRPRTRTGRDATGDDRTEPDRATSDRDDADADREGRRRPRSGKSDRDQDNDDDDDDDDEDLLPAALAGVAAVGVLVYVGRSVGYYGNSTTPFGLSAGYVEPRGGALLQVAVNDGVFGSGDPEKLLGKVTVFYDAFHAPLQPAAGLGVLAEEVGDDVDLTPALSLGAVGNFGPVLLYGGYDLATQGVDFSLVFNFRHKPTP